MRRYNEGDELPDEHEAYDMGFQGAADGLTDADNPFPISTDQHLSWNDGNTGYHDQQEQGRDEAWRAEQAQVDRRIPLVVTDQLQALRGLSMGQIATRIDVPLNDWPGNCFAIASKFVEAFELQGAVAVYGHYRGPISPRCALFNGKPLVHHGWVLLDEKMVLDPTRWVFEAKSPYLAIFEPWDDEHAAVFRNVEYDEGGEIFNAQLRGPRPLPDARQRSIEVDQQDHEILGVLTGLLGPGSGNTQLTLDELRWVAKTPYSSLGDAAAKVLYPWLAKAGYRALVPIDYLNRARRHGIVA